jgi:death on curing protein
MIRITVAEIIVMHHHIVDTIQGESASDGIRDFGVIDSALKAPFQSVFGHDQYPDPFSKAAAMAYGLIRGHGFVDGNKRIGLVAGMVLLELNGYRMTASNDDVYEAAYKTAAGEWDREELMTWFLEHVAI